MLEGTPPSTAPHTAAADLALLEQVAPSNWTNPQADGRYDLVVVGAGTAGLVAAAGAASLGARVALVERNRLGGDCLNFGCVPSKGIIRAARSWQAARDSAERFGGPPVSGPGSFRTAMDRMRRLRADIAVHDGAARFRDLGVDVYFGAGRFVAADGLDVAGERLDFRRALVATGGRPAVPTITGLLDAGYLTNETVFDLHELPASLAIIGAGPIGTELAQTFARFGTEVALLQSAQQILPREDAEAAHLVHRRLERDGVRIHLNVVIEEVQSHGHRRVVRFRIGEELHILEADQILVAAGRVANVDGLGLEAAGIEYSHRGVEVDDRLRTSNRKVFAAGDVASRYQFTHTADAQARLVLQNAFFFGRKRASSLVVPWVTYTSPEVAHVGLSAAEAEAQGTRIESLTVPLSRIDRARLDDEDEGFLRLHLKQGTDRILGATLVAANAGDMISEITLAMTKGLGLGTLAGVIHPYPTQAEVIKRAADNWQRRKLTPVVQRILEWWFRWFRVFA